MLKRRVLDFRARLFNNLDLTLIWERVIQVLIEIIGPPNCLSPKLNKKNGLPTSVSVSKRLWGPSKQQQPTEPAAHWQSIAMPKNQRPRYQNRHILPSVRKLVQCNVYYYRRYCDGCYTGKRQFEFNQHVHWFIHCVRSCLVACSLLLDFVALNPTKMLFSKL